MKNILINSLGCDPHYYMIYTANKRHLLAICALLVSTNLFAQYGSEVYTSKNRAEQYAAWTGAGTSEKEDMKKQLSQPAPEGSSAMHKKYVNQIVFSKEPIIYGQENESKFTTDFTFGDNIYCMAYFSKPVKELLKANNAGRMYLIYRDLPYKGPMPGSTTWKDMPHVDAGTENNSYLQYHIIKQPAEGDDWSYSSSMCNYLAAQHGNNRQYYVSLLNEAAFGIFSYNLEQATSEQFKSMANIFFHMGDKQRAQQQEAALNSKEMPEEWTAKSHPLTGGFSEAQIRAAYKPKAAGPGFKIVKLVADGSAGGWQVEKNDIGIPVYQSHSQGITLFCKDNEKCWRAQVTLRKQYLGSGRYDKAVVWFYEMESSDLLPCGKMK